MSGDVKPPMNSGEKMPPGFVARIMIFMFIASRGKCAAVDVSRFLFRVRR